MIRILLTLLLLTPYILGFAQERNITGMVTSDSDGSAIPGVNVVVKGTTTGTITDIDGKYSINVPEGSNTLVFSFIGLQTQEVAIGGQSVIDVSMTADVKQLTEVIVVAYGEQTKASFTGSGVELNAAQIEKRNVSNVTQAIEGAAPGVQVRSSSGQPGEGGSIRIRGVGSINASSDPLYVVDGVPYDGPISGLNPGDIESMTILKDAAANVLYGARAANGVVMITTKRGQEGKVNISLDARYGFNSRGIKEYERITDPGTYYEVFWEALKNQRVYQFDEDEATASQYATNNLISTLGYNAYDVADDELVVDGQLNENANLLYNTDWFDALYDPSSRQEYQLSLNGGDEKTKYFMSIGYLDDKGMIMKSDFERYSTRISLDREVTDWFKAGINSYYSSTNQNYPNFGDPDTGNNSIFYITRKIAPIYPIYVRDASGDLFLDDNGNRQYDWGDGSLDPQGRVRPFHSPANIIATLSENTYDNTYDNINVSLFGEFNFLQDFKLRFNSAINNSVRNQKEYWTPSGGDALAANGRLYKYNYRYYTENHNQLLTYKKQFDSHNIDVLVGHETYKYKYNYQFTHKSNLVVPGIEEFSNFLTLENIDGYQYDYSVEGFLSRINYDYDDFVFLSASYRRDGSSRFANKWGDFWSIGGAVRLSEIGPFTDFNWLNNLKLKASYGLQGNDNIFRPNSSTANYYAYQDLYEIGANGGLTLFQERNNNITWEKNGTFNVGFESNFFNSRVSLNVDVFNRKTSDLLFLRKNPLSDGLEFRQENIADMKNTGIEFDLGVDVIRTSNNFVWNIGINGTSFKNEITKLPEEVVEAGGQINGTKQWTVGGSIYDYFIREYAGVNPDNGAPLYYYDELDGDGNPTGERLTTEDDAEADRYFIGKSAIPDLFGGITTNIQWKGFDVSALFSYQLGGYVLDGGYQDLNDFRSNQLGVTYSTDVLNRWTPENPTSQIPRVEFGLNELSTTSTRFLQDASYLYFRNITVGYTLPTSLIERAHLQSVRVFFSGENLKLWSKRQGMDPTQAFNGNLDNRFIPLRTLVFGVNLKF